MPSHPNAYEHLQGKESCGTEFKWHLANEAVEKASVKGNIPQVATNRSHGDVLHIEWLLYYKDIPWVVQSNMRDRTGELRLQTFIGRSWIQHCVRMLQARAYIMI